MRCTWVFAVLLGACVGTREAGPLYFSDPESAVPAITALLEVRDWPTLARYYHLDGSNVDRAQLESGAFFYTEERPEAAHPAGFWHWRHPFAPGFTYLESRELQELLQVEVIVSIEIDQGEGPPQRGIQAFLMRRTPEGYQLLPGEAPTR